MTANGGEGSVVVVGGTAGIGRELARRYADQGRDVVISGRDARRARAVAGELGGHTTGIGLDLAEPQQIAERLGGVGPVGELMLVAVERDFNTVRGYDVARATRLATLKLVGYTEVVHALATRFTPAGSAVIFGGLAKDRPYPGSTTITTVNDAVSALVRTLVIELAPVRVNAIHPGIIGDHPAWSDKAAVLAAVRARTPLGRLVTIDEVVSATMFLASHPSLNGVDLNVDGGWIIT